MNVRDERGSAAVETVIGVPAFFLFLMMIVAGGRMAITHQAVEAAATDAARSASIARTRAQATGDAHAGATAALRNQNLKCLSTDLDVDTSGFSAPVGTPATVSATLTCVVSLRDVALPGLPGQRTITVTMTSPLDTYRERG